jgi:hypothetical protein
MLAPKQQPPVTDLETVEAAASCPVDGPCSYLGMASHQLLDAVIGEAVLIAERDANSEGPATASRGPRSQPRRPFGSRAVNRRVSYPRMTAMNVALYGLSSRKGGAVSEPLSSRGQPPVSYSNPSAVARSTRALTPARMPRSIAVARTSARSWRLSARCDYQSFGRLRLNVCVATSPHSFG